MFSDTSFWQPLLFPARLSHARRFPEIERYNYWYDYFLVGIPVGLRGRIGNLLSIDNLPAWERRWEKCWFTIDPAYYLDRGSGDRCLEEKLHIFLKSVGENPREFPYAYLVSVPRFLCFQKSAISYWYLYSANHELAAMIMEINNSFYEKRNIFFRLTGDDLSVDDPPRPATEITASPRHTNERMSIRFLSSASKSKHYKGSWEKLVFGSPFETLGSLMTAKFVDPLLGPSLQSNLSSNSPEGQVRVTSRLASWGEPVDPLSSTGWSIARFISRWTHVGALSAPRIVKEALRIRLRGNLQYLQRPEVREGSNPRKETEVERISELFFREYLSQLASRCSSPLSITYLPPKSIHFEPIVFQSPIPPASLHLQVLTVQPLTPRFYTSFLEYPNQKHAFNTESSLSPTNSDPESRRLSISDPCLLDQVLTTAGQALESELTKTSAHHVHHWTSTFFHFFISFLRSSSTPSFMDRFFEHFSPAPDQRVYHAARAHYLLACRLPIESQAIVQLGFIAVRTMLVDVFLHAAYRIWARERAVQWLVEASITPGVGALVYGGWEMVQNYIGEYYLNPFAWGEGL
ncbi:hypothetical protein EYZ11_012680 [Aspergillus tanneri]|uniref:Uncharacterized protein n=1 Tax=Aspergillus tanneri TaxID=1220188 RepID=A0A4S3J1R7_9EURO|nr:hypothetical protein EYZ11_012680 [Aspergillus tanneri]